MKNAGNEFPENTALPGNVCRKSGVLGLPMQPKMQKVILKFSANPENAEMKRLSGKCPKNHFPQNIPKHLTFGPLLQYNTLENRHFTVLHHSLMGIDTNHFQRAYNHTYNFTIPLWELILPQLHIKRPTKYFTIPLWELIHAFVAEIHIVTRLHHSLMGNDQFALSKASAHGCVSGERRQQKRQGDDRPGVFFMLRMGLWGKAPSPPDDAAKNAEGNSLIFAIPENAEIKRLWGEHQKNHFPQNIPKHLTFGPLLQYNTLENRHFTVLHHSLMGIDTNHFQRAYNHTYNFTIPLWELIHAFVAEIHIVTRLHHSLMGNDQFALSKASAHGCVSGERRQQKRQGDDRPGVFFMLRMGLWGKAPSPPDDAAKNAEGNSQIFCNPGKCGNEAVFWKTPQKSYSAKYSKTLDFWHSFAI